MFSRKGVVYLFLKIIFSGFFVVVVLVVVLECDVLVLWKADQV